MLGVSRSSYYDWLRRPKSARQQQDEELGEAIKKHFEVSKQRKGSRQLQEDLRREGRRPSLKRVQRVMRLYDLKPRRTKRYSPRTTDSSQTVRIAPNHLDRDFSAEAANRKWAGDITFVRTEQGWLFLAVVIDLYSRMIVGYAMSRRIDAGLVREALQMAIERRRPAPGLLFHSDRGSQYASDTFLHLLDSQGIIPSMSRRGNCWDNAVSESFFGTLKREAVHGISYRSYRHAESEIFEYIEGYYNRRRYHSTIDYCSPYEFEQKCCLLVL